MQFGGGSQVIAGRCLKLLNLFSKGNKAVPGELSAGWTCLNFFFCYPESQWLSTPCVTIVFQVMLGPVARVKVGDVVRMKYGVLLVADRIVVEPTNLWAVATTRAPVVPLQAVLLAPDAVQLCSTLRLSLAASSGFARRRLGFLFPPPFIFSHFSDLNDQ